MAVGATFSTVIDGGFIGLDDGNNIFLNPQMGALSAERVSWAFGDLGTARRYMPLGWLGFSAVFTWNGLAPAGYHAASLGWHLLGTLGLLAAVRSILRLDADQGRGNWTTWLSVLVAATWALHPMRVEAVAWASGLLYTQATALAFWALWLWTLRWSFPGKAGRLAAGSCLALAASLLTYPIALGLPVVCWLLDLAAARRTPEPAPPISMRERYRIGPALLGLTLVAGLCLAATLFARGKNPADFAVPASLADFGLLDRGWQALYVWGRYLVHLVYPVSLSPIYTELYSLHPLARDVLWTALLSVGLLMVGGWLVWRRRMSPGPVIAYTIMALPVLGLLEHPWIAHDRYAMLLHPVWLIAGARSLQRIKTPRICLSVSLALVVVIGVGSFQSRALVGAWRDHWTVHDRLSQLLPRNAWAGYYLGSVPVSVLFLEGRFAEIGPQLDRAEQDAPGWSADHVRKEYGDLVRKHEDFLKQNWPGRSLAPVAVLHFLHGKTAESRGDWFTARAHFQAALRVAGEFGEAREEMVRCDVQLAHPGGN
jgi:hypothetical protein